MNDKLKSLHRAGCRPSILVASLAVCWAASAGANPAVPRVVAGPQSGSRIGFTGTNAVRGSDAGTFGGERANNRGGASVMTQGGRVGRVTGASSTSKASEGEVTGNLEGDGERDIIGVTDEQTSGAREDRYQQTVGSDHYEATRNMTHGQRADYWRGQRDGQRSGSDRPREDDNFTSGGGSGIPIFLNRGQFGIAIRGVERALGARTGAAGGANDGRTDQQGTGGSGGGVMMQRGQQLGVGMKAASGTLNLDEALKINELVNPVRH